MKDRTKIKGKIISFKIEQEILDRLDKISNKELIPVSQIIRTSIKDYIERHYGRPKPNSLMEATGTFGKVDVEEKLMNH